MEILGIIPARGGSKGIPKKNLALCSGRPLITYTFDAVKQCRSLTRAIISTDSVEIADLARERGIEVPFMRPAELAQSGTPMMPVVLHALDYLEKADGYKPDIVMLFQPTSPLRTARHIEEAIDLLIRTRADSVVSVVEVPHQYIPQSLMTIADERIVFQDKDGSFLRQEKPKYYARNGAAIYAVKREFLLREKRLFGGDCRPYIMAKNESVDVDEKGDLELAEYFLGIRRTKAGAS